MTSGFFATSSRTAARACAGVETSRMTSVAKYGPPLAEPGSGGSEAVAGGEQQGELGVVEGSGPLLVLDPELDVVAVESPATGRRSLRSRQPPQMVEHVLAGEVHLGSSGTLEVADVTVRTDDRRHHGLPREIDS